MSGRDRVLLGTILAAHGIRGDVLIKTFTGDPMDIGSYGELTDGAGGRPISIRPRRLNAKGGLIAAVQGVTDRNGAEALKGAELWVSREQLPEPDDEEEFYYVDLIGLEAVDLAGKRFGRVQSVENYGAGDLLDVLIDETGKSELIPFKAGYVPSIDIEGGEISIAWPIQFEIAQESDEAEEE